MNRLSTPPMGSLSSFPSTSSATSTVATAGTPVDISPIHEFWLRPENYEDVPIVTAYEMYKLGLIDVTRFGFHTKHHPVVPANLEEMCESVVVEHFSSILHEKQEHFSWYYFLEMCIFLQTSEEYVNQEKNHIEQQKKYKSLLEEMDMVSGDTQSIGKFFALKQKMMMEDPVSALSMTPPVEWTKYMEYSTRDKREYRETFIAEFSREVCLNDVPESIAREWALKAADSIINDLISKRSAMAAHREKQNAIETEKIKAKKTKMPKFKKHPNFTKRRLIAILNTFAPKETSSL